MLVAVNGSNSQIKAMNIGLSQGTVTSPSYFHYMRMICIDVQTKLTFIHFADDTTVFMSAWK